MNNEKTKTKTKTTKMSSNKGQYMALYEDQLLLCIIILKIF